jgi:hypothetical protein
VKDVREIGTAVGIGGSIRSALSSVASAIYIAVLTSRLIDTIPEKVVPAVVGAGLPQTSIIAYFAAAQQGTAAAFEAVEEITPAILEAGAAVYKVAYFDAFNAVFLSTIAFTVIAIVLAFWIPNMEKLMTNKVSVTLHSEKENAVSENIVAHIV